MSFTLYDDCGVVVAAEDNASEVNGGWRYFVVSNGVSTTLHLDAGNDRRVGWAQGVTREALLSIVLHSMSQEADATDEEDLHRAIRSCEFALNILAERRKTNA